MTTKPALIRPFAGVLPPRDKAHLVATRSYLTYTDDELQDKLSRNPFSYMHVIHPHGVQSPHGADMTPVRQAFESFVDRGWLVRDAAPHFYLMRQESEHGVVTGIVALVDTGAAENGQVKAHEATLSREGDALRPLPRTGGPQRRAHVACPRPFSRTDRDVRTEDDGPARPRLHHH